jgi:hypothetical protein
MRIGPQLGPPIADHWGKTPSRQRPSNSASSTGLRPMAFYFNGLLIFNTLIFLNMKYGRLRAPPTVTGGPQSGNNDNSTCQNTFVSTGGGIVMGLHHAGETEIARARNQRDFFIITANQYTRQTVRNPLIPRYIALSAMSRDETVVSI